nr:hypothetical protein CFP56_09633 [Quercus suber]
MTLGPWRVSFFESKDVDALVLGAVSCPSRSDSHEAGFTQNTRRTDGRKHKACRLSLVLAPQSSINRTAYRPVVDTRATIVRCVTVVGFEPVGAIYVFETLLPGMRHGTATPSRGGPVDDLRRLGALAFSLQALWPFSIVLRLPPTIISYRVRLLKRLAMDASSIIALVVGIPVVIGDCSHSGGVSDRTIVTPFFQLTIFVYHLPTSCSSIVGWSSSMRQSRCSEELRHHNIQVMIQVDPKQADVGKQLSECTQGFEMRLTIVEWTGIWAVLRDTSALSLSKDMDAKIRG